MEIFKTGKSQHGFKRKHSTNLAGLVIQSMIAHALDEDKFCLMANIDLSAAMNVSNVLLVIAHNSKMKKTVSIGLKNRHARGLAQLHIESVTLRPCCCVLSKLIVIQLNLQCTLLVIPPRLTPCY